jgi:hypothetical protein
MMPMVVLVVMMMMLMVMMMMRAGASAAMMPCNIVRLVDVFQCVPVTLPLLQLHPANGGEGLGVGQT